MSVRKFSHQGMSMQKFSHQEMSMRNSSSALRSCLQMAITSLFQLQIAHRLKRWTPDFPSFKLIYTCKKWTPGSAPNLPCNCCPLNFAQHVKISHHHAELPHDGFLSLILFLASLDWLGNSFPRVAQISPSFLACFNDKKSYHKHQNQPKID